MVARRPVRSAGRRALVTAPSPTNPVLPEQSGFVVELEQFSGPLDLLLHLIREDELDITDLPIAKIADQFLAVINELGLNQAADYLRSEEHTSELQSRLHLVCRLLLEKKKKKQ